VTKLSERIYRTEAIILRRTDLSEADRILTLYTPQWGKLRGIAKGIRRPASKLRGHLELFTRSKLLMARGRNLDVITGAETTEAFHGLRDEHPDALERIGIAYYLAELLDRFTEDGVENRAIWDLLVAALRALSDGVNPAIVARHYELRLLGYLGYQPNLDTCAGCDEPLEPVENRYSIELGGVLCPECRSHDPAAEPLSVNALKLLRLLAREDARTVARLRIPPALGGEVETILRRSIRQIADRDLASPAVLRSLQGV
jgi:DNA repair protein RecO (recombination protein O)